VINRRNGCGTTLFKKGLTDNVGFDFKRLIPKPYPAWSTGATVGDQPAQRFAAQPFSKKA